MNVFLKTARRAAAGLLVLGLLGALTIGVLYLYIAPNLPSIEALRDIHLQVPLRVYTRDMKLIAEFGEKKRTPIRFYETPDLMVKAILAAEDDRFFKHPGVDYHGILRAAFNLLATGEKTQGGSTITMQVARNFFLSSEKTYLRKLSEIFLALKIERELSKEEILELYLNKIYLGNRAYGVAAAGHVYYGRAIADLTTAQMAMIAGLPKAPSRFNPIADPERALLRRNYVLRRMRELDYLDEERYRAALLEPDDAQLHGLSVEVEASYVAEMVRTAMVETHGEDAYSADLRVVTTIDSRLQEASTRALREALLDYDRRHGYRGADRRVDFRAFTEPGDWSHALDGLGAVGGLQPAVVVRVEEQSVTALLADLQAVEIPWQGLSWARRYISDDARGDPPTTAADIVRPGDVIRVERRSGGTWWLAQIPAAEGALVALRPGDGAIAALAGGFDFYRSKFNRVVQATRQPGSSFKPFIYSAALERGFTAASLINDAPVVFDDPGLESVWRPENYSGKFFGPTRLRVALVHSRNLVSIRLLRSVGVDYTLDYVRRFGFNPADLPHDLSLALGSGSVTPLDLASGFAVFANGGYRVAPYFIERVLDPDGAPVFEARPAAVCRTCPAPEATPAAVAQDDAAAPPPAGTTAERVIPADNVYLMTTMMRDVIRSGTGRRARQLGRNDVAGKTGTTNDQRDAWFAGFNADLAAVAWVGFDKTRSLGSQETGARAALPMWIAFMETALRGTPETPLDRPPGLVTVRIDPETGLLAPSNRPDAIFETFRTSDVPRQYADSQAPGGERRGAPDTSAPEQLF